MIKLQLPQIIEWVKNNLDDEGRLDMYSESEINALAEGILKTLNEQYQKDCIRFGKGIVLCERCRHYNR